MSLKRRTVIHWLRIALIWLISVAAVQIIAWFAPSLSNASINMLFRLRGELKAPDNIVIVAIDDASLQRLGKYPWSRRITAEGLNKISAGHPQAVGIDIIYAEETAPEDDKLLAAAIKKNGRVVLPVQLFENASETSPEKSGIEWLYPLPEFSGAAAAKGHAHAAPGVDGTLRSVQLKKSDHKGHVFWAFGLEVLRVAEQIGRDDFEEKPGTLRFGSYDIRLFADETESTETPGVSIIRPNEMLINYAGTAKSFKYYSFADVLDGRIPPETFTGKIVLVGATSPTLGDTQVTPFMHYAGTGDREGGQGTPGVEVHANIINTIKNHLWLGFLPWFLEIALALLIIFVATVAVKLLDGWQQVLALSLLILAVVGGSLLSFNTYYLILPLPEMLTAFLAAVPLLLIDRSLAASRDLDIKLNLLSEVQKDFLFDPHKDAQKLNRSMLLVPHNLESKLRAVDDITARLLSRLSFINRVLAGMSEGVIVADTSHRIVFINHSFTEMFDVNRTDFVGHDFTDFFVERNIFTETEFQEISERVLGGQNYEKEFETSTAGKHHYYLRFSPVTAADETDLDHLDLPAEELPAASVIGILILFADVTEQRELDRLKAETVQLVSHELRAPLTSIQSLSDVLLKFPVSADESGEMLATIHSEAVRLNDLINRFLNIKRLESGVQDLQISSFNVDKLITDAVSVANIAAAEKNIKLQFLENQPNILFEADAELLKQAVGNLLSNAVKYSPPQTVVKIEAVKSANELRIIVRDEGYGVPANSLTRIFENFYRLARDLAAGTIGTGLGLPLVKDIAEKHGGRVTVESEENVGSTFVIHLPD